MHTYIPPVEMREGFKTKKNTTMKKSDRQKARHIRKLMEACHKAGIKTILLRKPEQLNELTSNFNLN